MMGIVAAVWETKKRIISLQDTIRSLFLTQNFVFCPGFEFIATQGLFFEKNNVFILFQMHFCQNQLLKVLNAQGRVSLSSQSTLMLNCCFTPCQPKYLNGKICGKVNVLRPVIVNMFFHWADSDCGDPLFSWRPVNRPYITPTRDSAALPDFHSTPSLQCSVCVSASHSLGPI